jgi:arylsulfatase A-like enzyme/tetratricopeptide (TPR) repeat protein
MTGGTARLILVFGLLAASCAGPGGQGDAETDVVLITIDTMRADRLRCYGDARAETPALDALAARGARFTRASAVAPITLPAHASILTGLYPARHGVRNNGTFVLPEAQTTLAEVLADRGYRSAAFVGAFVLAHHFGLGQGFDHFDARFDGPGAIVPPEGLRDGASASERRAGAVTDSALAWLDERSSDESVFLWAHYFDPHADYAPPAEFMTSGDRYRGEIAYTDREIGRLVDGLRRAGRFEDALIVVVSDHGEAFGEHGEKQHGLFLYDPTVRVPMLVSWPSRIAAGTVIEHDVSQVDIVPTVLSLLGIEIPNGLDGLDLVPLLTGVGSPPDRAGVVAENHLPRLEFGWSETSAVIGGGWKYIEAPRPELYHLDEDPGEERNLADTNPSMVEKYRGALREAIPAEAESAGGEVARTPDAEEVSRLRSLGYVVSGERPDREGPGADPKDKVEEYLALKGAYASLARGDYQRAIEEFEGVLALDPGNLYSRRFLGEALVLGGRLEEAERLYRDITRDDPADCAALASLGKIEAVGRDNLASAVDWYRSSLDCNPNQPELWGRLSAAQAQLGDREGALAHVARAIELDPDNAKYHRQAAELSTEAGDLNAARNHWKALDRLTPSAMARNEIGLINERGGDFDEAERWFRAALEVDESNAVALANIGRFMLRVRRYEEGIEYTRQALASDPSMTQARFNLAIALVRVGELDAAREEMMRYARSEPSDPRGWIELAKAYETAGRADDANEAWKAAVRAVPDDLDAGGAARPGR